MKSLFVKSIFVDHAAISPCFAQLAFTVYVVLLYNSLFVCAHLSYVHTRS